MKKLVWLLLLSVVLSACGSSTSSVSNTTSGVSVAKSVFNRTESSALQGTASQVIKSSVSGSAIAIYNPANGQVTIPQLQVSGDTSGTTYSVEMMFQGDFLVVTSLVVVGTSAATSATALYYPFTGTVNIPYLTVTGDTSGTQYTVSLQQQGNSMNFSVANVALVQQVDFTVAAGTYPVLSPNKGIITVDSNGNLTITESGAVIGSGKLTATSSSTLFNFTASFMDGDTLQGTLDTTTGQFSGTKNNSETLGVFAQKLVFTTAMLSPFFGKTMSFVSYGAGDKTTTTTMTINADGTMTSPMIQSGTWSINASGQLVYTVVFPSGTHSAETDIATLTSVTATGFTANVTWKSVDGDSGTNTQSYTLM